MFTKNYDYLAPFLPIAVEVGYEDPYYFSRVFRKLMGLPPRQYRILRKG
ncbi:AraC family transcriptional regulator [Teredinibacter franksiae]